MVRYSEEKKIQILSLYNQIMREGSAVYEGMEIESVRGLCVGFGISSSTLYRWVEEFDIVIGISKPSKPKAKPSVDSMINETFNILGNVENKNGRLEIASEQRFLGFLASTFKIKNYGSFPINQLYLKLGLEFMKRSGLVKEGIN